MRAVSALNFTFIQVTENTSFKVTSVFLILLDHLIKLTFSARGGRIIPQRNYFLIHFQHAVFAARIKIN